MCVCVCVCVCVCACVKHQRKYFQDCIRGILNSFLQISNPAVLANFIPTFFSLRTSVRFVLLSINCRPGWRGQS